MRTTLHFIYHTIRRSSRKCREHASHSAKPDVSAPEASDLHHSKFICKRNRRHSRNIRCCIGRYMVIHRMNCCVLQVIAFPHRSCHLPPSLRIFDFFRNPAFLTCISLKEGFTTWLRNSILWRDGLFTLLSKI